MGSMLAREKWQIRTIQVLEMVFEERIRQMEKHQHAMMTLPDGIGPDVQWLDDVVDDREVTAEDIQKAFRYGYETVSEEGGLTRMHLVREELAEMFECDPDSQEFIDEALQVAGLCVQWIEYKLEGL